MRSKNLEIDINRVCALGDAVVLKWALRTFEIIESGGDVTSGDLQQFIECNDPE